VRTCGNELREDRGFFGCDRAALYGCPVAVRGGDGSHWMTVLRCCLPAKIEPAPQRRVP
jgi:hypothetical protein